MSVMLYVSKRCRKFFVWDVVKCVLLLIVAVGGIWGVEAYGDVIPRSAIMVPVALGVVFFIKASSIVFGHSRGRYY